jgi:hypothetical protein
LLAKCAGSTTWGQDPAFAAGADMSEMASTPASGISQAEAFLGPRVHVFNGIDGILPRQA